MYNIYYSPEKFGLTTVGEIELSDGCYQFDTIVLFRNAAGDLLYAHDSGCSCPCPFESHGVDDLTPCTLVEFQVYVESQYSHTYSEIDRVKGELVDLIIRVQASP